MHFKSKTQTVLATENTQAQYRGSGTLTVNGVVIGLSDGWDYMISGKDNNAAGGDGGVDRARIKIWDNDPSIVQPLDGAINRVIYDNQRGSPEDGAATPKVTDGQITIHDPTSGPGQNPKLPSVKISGVSLDEGNAGITNFEFILTRTGNLEGSSLVSYETADDTATSPADYISQSETVTFVSGQAQEIITIGVIGDGIPESDEKFNVNLLSCTDCKFKGSNTPVGTILNDDAGAPPPPPGLPITITAVVPSMIPKGSIGFDVDITGTGFTLGPGTTVTFENGAGSAPKATNVVVDSDTNISFDMTVKPRAKVTTWDLRVTSPDGATFIFGISVT